MIQCNIKEETMPNTYEELLSKYPLKKIKTESENDYYLEIYKKYLDMTIKDPTLKHIEEYLDALFILIEEFESKAYPTPDVSGVDMLKFLMDQHKLKQVDLLDIFKTKSIISEILSGKRNLTVEHIKKLSKRFNLSTDCFI